ncbi:SRPBCC family protein [Aeromicrobium panaciterrae]|uniref:SRPBCC family protein n=1 Tax=Aeromicrobium panaciterrae TaxID=363861 RepID=UPI0031DE2C59
MTTNSRLVDATPAQVWDVLSDGWLYPVWVVGAARMREVTEDWPGVGAKLHHSVGMWPVMLDDNTEVLDSSVGRRLRLKARAFPAGAAEVEIRLAAEGARTRVTITEKVVDGPARLVPPPVESAAMKWRNTETLRRLAYVVEGRR